WACGTCAPTPAAGGPRSSWTRRGEGALTVRACRRVAALLAALLAVAVCACGRPGAPAAGRTEAAVQAAPAPVDDQRPHRRGAAGHDLGEDEALGGHTLQRHVGRSDADLIARLTRERDISSASTYTDRATAEEVVGAALRLDNRAFAGWRERTGRRPNFVLRYRAGRPIGRSIRRGPTAAVA